MPVRAMFAIHTQAGQSSFMVYSIPSVQNTWYIFVFFKVNLEFHIDNALSYTIYFYNILLLYDLFVNKYLLNTC